MEEIEEVEIFEKSFKIKDRLFRYRFTDLEIEQAELCREIGELKAHQINQPPPNIIDLMKSQSAETTSFLSAFLFKEVIGTDINGEVKPFNRATAEIETFRLIKSLPVSEWETLEVSIKDFFTSIGRGQIGSMIYQREKKRSETETLQLLMSLASMSKNSELIDTQEN